MAEAVASHISACASCAEAASEAANETMMLASAFEAEMALDVPTVSLRERLDAAIADINRPAQKFESKQDKSLSGWFAPFAGLFKLSPQRALGFASLIAAVAFAVIFAVMRLDKAVTNDASPSPSLIAEKKEKSPSGGRSNPSPTPTAQPDKQSDTPGIERIKGVPGKRTKPKKQVSPNLVPEPNQLPKDELATKPLPGEQNYLKAIDSLSVEISASGETAMKPSLRAEYERNLAIVDQAIDATRRTARRNPNDPDAAEFLYSSYQSKLDLLTAVAQQVRPVIATR
jgi:hypothetical protein